MGQFTGLFNGLENAEIKKQPKPKAAKSEKRSPDKPAIATPSAKPLPSAQGKSKTEKLRNTTAAEAPAPMRGKRSHPDYTQAPAFVRKNTYKAVKIALLNGERGLDYSDLVEELLITWLKNNK